MRGGFNSTLWSRSSNAPRMGSIISEWNACEVNKRRQETDCFVRLSFRASISGVGPETTQRPGLLIAAKQSVPLR